MEKKQTNYESSVKRYLESYRQRLSSAGQTKPDRAEHAIRELYLRVKDRRPELILWCKSPYQMAVLPPLFASVLETKEWRRLVAKVRLHSSGSLEWESAWKEQWNRLTAAMDPLFMSILEHPREYSFDASVRISAVERLEDMLRDALKQGKLDDDLIDTKVDKHAPENYRRIKHDRDFYKFATIVQACAERAAGLPLGVDLDLPQNGAEPDPVWSTRIADFSIMTRGITQGVFLGTWDPRLVTKVLPATEKLMPQLDPADREAALRIKQMCIETEQIARRRLTWFRRLPPLSPAFNPADVQKWNEEWGQKWDARINGKSKLEQIQGVVQTGMDGFSSFNKMVREQIGLRNQGTLWFPYSDWIPFTFACLFLDQNFFGKLKEDIDILAALGHGACGYFFCSKVCFVCEAPLKYKTNAAGRPHSEDGPAAVWADGFKVYSWRGIPVAPTTIEHKNRINVNRIHAEKNAEIKRVMIDIYGESRYLMDAGAKVIHADECGTLYRADIEHEEPLVMVKVRNSTPEPDGTYKHYFLRVPPTMLRAREAVAWTFGLPESEYHPTHHS